MIDWFALKSGSDIRGVAIETEASEVTLTDEVIVGITTGFFAWLTKHGLGTKVAVGRDSRLSGEHIQSIVMGKLAEFGTQVVDCGLCTTPAMYMTTVDETMNCTAAISITASHHPFDKNGLKFFISSGGLEASDINEILQYAREGTCFSKREGSITKISYIDIYAQQLVSFVQGKTGKKKPLVGLKIVVDAGNGVGGFYADKVLKPLGAKTDGSRFLTPDGRFPNHIPNPENKQAMQSICDAVEESGADFGIIFDTDVDRAGAVDASGNEINRNRMIALISAILLSERSPATIVTDSVTSDGLSKFIEAKGGKHIRFKRGYKNVINECIRRNNDGEYCPLAIETSGHAALSENYYLDDGAYLVTRIVAAMSQARSSGKNIMDLITDLPQPIEEAEIRLKFNVSDFASVGGYILSEIERNISNSDNMTLCLGSYEGVRINFGESNGDGFCLVRLSVHDPIMPINIESNSRGGCRLIAQQLCELLQKFNGLDVSNLQKFISDNI